MFSVRQVHHTQAELGICRPCEYEHCEGLNRDRNTNVFTPCTCLAFRLTAQDVPKPKRAKAEDHTPCRACGHAKAFHCSKRMPSKAHPKVLRDRLGRIIRPRSDSGVLIDAASAYQGFATAFGQYDFMHVNGMQIPISRGNRPYQCQHWRAAAALDPEGNPPQYKCTSTSCACADETGNFCACKKFVNPFTAPRKLSESRAKLRCKTSPRRMRCKLSYR